MSCLYDDALHCLDVAVLSDLIGLDKLHMHEHTQVYCIEFESLRIEPYKCALQSCALSYVKRYIDVTRG